MYIYQTTHIPTKTFYIGFSTDTVINTDQNKDPMNVFESVRESHNGFSISSNLTKRVVTKVGDYAEASKLLADLAKQFSSDPGFLGVKTKTTHKEEKLIESKKPIPPVTDNK